MTEVDPQLITSAQWGEVSTTLFYLWVFWISMLGVAVNFLIAHAVIPSFVITGHLPSRVQAVRSLFYFVALSAFAVAAFSFFNFVDASEVMRTIYPKVWI